MITSIRTTKWFTSLCYGGFFSLLAIGISGGLAGCASQAELPPQMTQDLGGLRDQLVAAKAQIQTTCNAARDLTTRPQAQLDPQVNRLVKSIAALDDMATAGRKQFSNADERAQSYFATWDAQMKNMSDSLASKGQQRREESMKSFNELKARIEPLKKEFRPFMASLREISTYLQTDTTASGVKAVTSQINTTLDKEDSLMEKADAVIAQIDAMRGGK